MGLPKCGSPTRLVASKPCDLLLVHLIQNRENSLHHYALISDLSSQTTAEDGFNVLPSVDEVHGRCAQVKFGETCILEYFSVFDSEKEVAL